MKAIVDEARSDQILGAVLFWRARAGIDYGHAATAMNGASGLLPAARRFFFAHRKRFAESLNNLFPRILSMLAASAIKQPRLCNVSRHDRSSSPVVKPFTDAPDLRSCRRVAANARCSRISMRIRRVGSSLCVGWRWPSENVCPAPCDGSEYDRAAISRLEALFRRSGAEERSHQRL